MKKIILLCLSLLLVCNIITTYAQPDIKAQSAILASVEGNQIIFEKNPDDKVNPAGLTKLVTALVAYEICGMDKIVTIPDNIKEYQTSTEPSIKLKPNEQIKSADLISAMIITSANDASISLAIHCSGTVDDFVNKMNEKAKSINLTSTNFVNPTGSQHENQYTTANDMLKIYSEIYKIKPLSDILNRKNIILPPTNLSPKREYWTGNHLISTYIQTKYYYPYVLGGKAASSNDGGSLAVHGKKSGTELISIVFNSTIDKNTNNSFADAKNMFAYGFENYNYKNVVNQDELICETKVLSSINNEHLLLFAGSSLKALILNSDSIDNVQKEIKVNTRKTPPIRKGDVMGEVIYTYQGKSIGTVDLMAGSDVRLNIFKYIFNSIFWFLNLTIIKIILSIFIAVIIFYIGFAYVSIKKQVENKKLK